MCLQSANQQNISEYNEMEYLQFQHFLNLKSHYKNVLDKKVEEGPLKDEIDKKIHDFFEMQTKHDPNVKEYVLKSDRKKRDLSGLFEIKNDFGNNLFSFFNKINNIFLIFIKY